MKIQSALIETTILFLGFFFGFLIVSKYLYMSFWSLKFKKIVSLFDPVRSSFRQVELVQQYVNDF